MQNSIIRQNYDVIIALICALIACVYTVWYVNTHSRITVKYDCSIAEISPDFPVEVKEQCRKLRAENILQKPK
jgi:hypothetical protein